MEKRKYFSQLNRSLSSGFFADNVVMLLNRLLKTKKLLEDDVETLNSIDEFFSDVIEGYNWSDEPSFSEQSLKYASSFSEAMTVITSAPSMDGFIEYINRLQNIANDIRDSKLEDSDIKILDDFFFAFSKFELQKTDHIIHNIPSI